MLIKSKVKYIQTLSQKKVRDTDGIFVAEGTKSINDFLASGNTPLEALYYLPEWAAENGRLLSDIPESTRQEITAMEMEKISFLHTPSPVLGLFKKPVFRDQLQTKQSFGLVLDAIQDPGNMGTIIRTADWFGVSYIICHGDCADCFSPKVVQSTMGSLARVRIEYRDAISFLKDNIQVPVFAALLEGKSMYELPKQSEGVLLIGNESKGLRPELLQGNIQPVTIPGRGGAESLNAAVATGILLSHLI